jgi:quinol monooxygenase YgiN
MNFIQKNLKPLLAVCLAATLFSCNNSEEKKEEPAKPADTTATKTTAAAPAVFTPFDVVEINHSVKDFAKWKPAFDADSTARKAAGLDFIVIGRNNADPNNLTIALKASDVQKAKAFAADPRLKDVMEKNGVTSKPDIGYYHVIRYNADSKEKQWVLVSHKVKDFDAWVKVFDAEGSATRAANGLVDVVLARGIDDPNLVHLVFDITDMAKAKARMSSPDLKKIMMGAGVEGAPKIEFYTSAE